MPAEPLAGRLHLRIVGPGRAGLALGLALHRSGVVDWLTVSGRRGAAPDHPLFQGDSPPARYQVGLYPLSPPLDALVISVPDRSVPAVAEELATATPPPGLVVLHTSGVLDSEALAGLRARGCAVGSLHPLVAISEGLRAVDRLAGAWFAVEGDPAAVGLAERIVTALGGRVLPIRAGAKPLYHAGAVFASNYVVALMAVAERLVSDAGAPEAAAREAVCDLARGALEAVAERGPVHALTGPISRGDAETIAAHLARLSPPDAALYSVLARATLEIARARGLDAEAAAGIEHLLSEVR